MLCEKPNASTAVLEAMILYSHNKTTQWLHEQGDGEKEKLYKILILMLCRKFKLANTETTGRITGAKAKSCCSEAGSTSQRERKTNKRY